MEDRLQYIFKEGAKVTVNFDSLNFELPDYFDEEKFRLGQQVFHNNIFAMMVAKLCGLVTVMAAPSTLDILIFTKKSGTPSAAFRRYFSTIQHMLIWYETRPVKQFESLQITRKKHLIASRQLEKGGLHKISQLEMACAQFGFIGFILLSQERLGIIMRRNELEGLLHLWRVIGSLFGMEEIFNICNGTPEECQTICQRLLDDIFLPHLFIQNDRFEQMEYNLIEGLWPISFSLNSKAFMAFTKMLANESSSKNSNHKIVIDMQSMSLTSKIILKTQLFVHKSLLEPRCWWSKVFRTLLNSLIRKRIFLVKKSPQSAHFLLELKKRFILKKDPVKF